MIQKLTKVLPTEKELNLMGAHKQSLSIEESFMYTLGSIPMLSKRLNVMKFLLEFNALEEVCAQKFISCIDASLLLD